MQHLALLLFTSFLLSSCALSNNHNKEPDTRPSKFWLGLMDANNDSIPFRFSLTGNRLEIINAEERITLMPDSLFGDTIVYSFPQYESKLIFTYIAENSIKGYWHYYSKGDYIVPFYARPTFEHNCVPGGSKTKYQVVINPGDIENSQLAIGDFNLKDNNCLTGTFLTESGDYRFLQGEQNDSTMWLSCFDGAHLFLFRGTIKGDSIVDGKFLSGNHWEVPWCAVLSENTQLKHPDSLTHFKSNDKSLLFSAFDLNGNLKSFGPEEFKDKVTIVQIFGSWCPNCYDEMVAYSDLNQSLSDPRLQIIPVAFERTDSLPLAIPAIRKVVNYTKLPFEPYFGGKASKTRASEVFSQLSPISSFPTSIFIGKDGRVRKIHTGFYGPGTGKHYESYKKDLKEFTISLLRE